jgi:hypothetical protein
MSRELSEEEARLQAEALRGYLAKPVNRGAAFWFASKDLGPADRRTILHALSGNGDAP